MRSMLLAGLVIVATFAGCRHGPSTHGEEAMVQAVSPDLVTDAILAQTSGPGGCVSVAALDSARNSYFPDVDFIHGYCVGEHGDTLQGIVAVDSSGVLYLLDSPSAYRLLARRHPPVVPHLDGADTAAVLDYVRNGLVLMGYMSPPARFARSAAAVPRVALQASGLTAAQIPGTFIESNTGPALAVWVTAVTPTTVEILKALVVKAGGDIQVVAP
ncbi:MAG TPA: hypothetical protein VFL95_01775 [Gemmatimonadales bacterium]|nr:hypothetical protein [Gemmatimonadales bacterium]